MPNCYDWPETEQKMINLGGDAHRNFKAEMFKRSEQVIKNVDAVLVLNYDKVKNDLLTDITKREQFFYLKKYPKHHLNLFLSLKYLLNLLLFDTLKNLDNFYLVNLLFFNC